MGTHARVFERGEQVGFEDVPGFVVLLDADMNEVVPRQDGTFSWTLIPGGATYQVTSSHEWDINAASVTYLAVGSNDHNRFTFVSIVAGNPVEGGQFTIRP